MPEVAMQIPAFDPRPQDEPLLEDIKAAVSAVLNSGRYIGGEPLEAFERELAAFVGTEHAVGVSSGTDALLVALMAHEVGPGDVVLTTPFTFFATAGVVRRLGAAVKFCDVDDELFLDIEAARRTLESTSAAGQRIAAILPVHLFGRVADGVGWQKLAADHGSALIEDAAQAIGARREGRAAGAFGRAGCFSFYPTKNLGAVGDAGAVVCDDSSLAERLRSLRNHGMGVRYEHHHVGGNFRLDALQAATLRVKLPHLEGWNAERRRLAGLYEQGFAARELDEVRRPGAGLPGEHVFHQYVVRVPRRDELRAALAEAGIGSSVYYPVALHRQPCFADLGAQEDCPRADQAVREVLALPIFPGLGDAAVERVVDAIASFYRG